MKEQAVALPIIEPDRPPLHWDDDKVIRVANTRVTLDSLVAAFHNGETPEQIAQDYDVLSLAEVYRAIGYYLAHRSEVDAYLEERIRQRKEVQREIESRNDPTGIRDRLLARKAQQS